MKNMNICTEDCSVCMKLAPNKYCCRFECGEHEFCRNCEFIKNKKYTCPVCEKLLHVSSRNTGDNINFINELYCPHCEKFKITYKSHVYK